VYYFSPDKLKRNLWVFQSQFSTIAVRIGLWLSQNGWGVAAGAIVGAGGFAFKAGHAVSRVIFGEHLAVKVIQAVTNKAFETLFAHSSAIFTIMPVI
jgi:hypothetical protein